MKTEKESEKYERKSCQKSLTNSIWETYSAFCNTSGGTIVLGVSDDGKTIGVENPEKIISEFWSTINNQNKVSANVLKNEDVKITESDGKTTITIKIPKADRRFLPVFINGNVNNGSFRRNGEGDYHCTPSEIKEMIRDSGDVTADETVLENLPMDCLDSHSVSSYRNYLRSIRPEHRFLCLGNDEFLEVIGATEKRNGEWHPTAAGLLMFGKEHCITKEFPLYFLDYRETVGNERWSYRIFSQSGDWSGNVYDYFTEVSNRLAHIIGNRFELDGMARKDISEATECAREALVNALVNADYYGRQGISVIFDGNKIELSNPGVFRIPVKRAMRGGCSDSRNNNIAKLFSIIGFVEHIGSGVFEMKKASENGFVGKFSIKEETDPSRTTVSLELEQTEKYDDRKRTIANMMAVCPRISMKKIASKLNVSEKTVARDISEMKKIGIVERNGCRRGGKWDVKWDIFEENHANN